MLVVLGLALTVLGFVRFTDTFEEVRDHYATPACTAAARPGDDCTRQESGRVTRKREPAADSDSTSYLLTVARETAPTEEYDVGKPFFDDVNPGDTVDLKVLHGKVFELDFHGHRSQTETAPWASCALIGGLIAGGLVLLLTDPRRRQALDELFMAVVMAVVVVGLTLLAAMSLVSFQWPLVITLVVAAVCWAGVGALCRIILFGEFSGDF
ncbi:hypothetical protein ACFVXG_27400 [Kitasatospora sp. NPDC058162]|uniref:hypothetical protein n=1 Tax=Kitasatospora sp. NPDC058162 TaxID=3346362 RepID=UPI0036D8D562